MKDDAVDHHRGQRERDDRIFRIDSKRVIVRLEEHEMPDECDAKAGDEIGGHAEPEATGGRRVAMSEAIVMVDSFFRCQAGDFENDRDAFGNLARLRPSVNPPYSGSSRGTMYPAPWPAMHWG